MSQIRHISEDTPGDTEIQVLIFDHRQISKRRTFGNLRVFEIHVFVFDFRWFIKVGEKSWDIRDINAFNLAEVLILSWPQYNQAIWLIFSNTTSRSPTPAENGSSRFSAGQLKVYFLTGLRLSVGRPYLFKHISRLGVAARCMIKIFWGAGVMTPSKPLPPTNKFRLYPFSVKMFLERSLNDPHPPLQASFREDSKIDFATGNVFLHVSLRPPPPCLETLQSKIDNQFKMCGLANVDDA